MCALKIRLTYHVGRDIKVYKKIYRSSVRIHSFLFVF